MRESEIHSYPRQLLEAHGAKAIAEAAQNTIDLEAKGEVQLAKTSRHVEDAMKLMRGPHQRVPSCRIEAGPAWRRGVCNLIKISSSSKGNAISRRSSPLQE